MTKGTSKLAGAISRETLSCIRNFNREDGVIDLAQCVSDDRKGKVAKTKARTPSDDVKRCAGTSSDGERREPAVFYASGESINTITDAATDLLLATYGSSSADAALTESANPAAAQCQERVAKRLERCHRTRVAEFARCSKSTLKDGGDTVAALAPCLSNDSRNKIAK